MSKDDKTFDLEDRLIDFALRIIRRAEALILQDEKVRKLHNSTFVVRYSIFVFY